MSLSNSQENTQITLGKQEAIQKAIQNLPDDVYRIIAGNLDLLSSLACRATCREFYSAFNNELTFSRIALEKNITKGKFDKLVEFLRAANCLKLVRHVAFYESQISVQAVISMLELCEKLQSISIVGCKDIAIQELTGTLVKWNLDDSGRSPNLAAFKKFTISRCVGGRRHSLLIKNIVKDLSSLRDGQNGKPSMFNFVECDDPNCDRCSQKCGACGVRYKYWDEFWIDCGWCKKRRYCGTCVADASRRNAEKNYTFQLVRIRLCQIFDLKCVE